MEITHSYLRMAAGLALAAGLASACSGGGSSGAAMMPEPTEPEPPAPMVGTVTTNVPAGCTASSPTCTSTAVTTAEDGSTTTVVTVTTNAPDADANENTRTRTVDGAMRTITVMELTDAEDGGRVKSVEEQTCTGGENCVRVSIANYVYEDADDRTAEVTTTVADPAVEGGTIATRSFSGGEGDKLMDMSMVTRAAPGEGETMGAITDDIVVNPGVQSHAIVSDEQYGMIQAGLAPRSNSRTLMGQATLHLSYEDDDAFNGWHADLVTADGDTGDLEVELHTGSPDCSAGGSCTYNALSNVGLAPSVVGDVRLYENNAGSADTLLAGPPNFTGGSGPSGILQPFWNIFANSGTGAYDTSEKRVTQGVLLQLVSDLLDVGGAGLSSEYTATAAGNVAALRADATAAAPTNTVDPTYRFVATPAAEMDSMDRNTYTYLRTADLPDGVTGIGRQVRQVDSYLRLGGRRAVAADPDADPAVDAVAENKVSVTAENYFGWMANSMFTVRRVTAANPVSHWFGVADETSPADPAADDNDGDIGADPADRVRVLVGMVSGDPSVRPEVRRMDGMTDPGTWTGSMIGVGTVHGERYMGDALVSVVFSNNSVTTQFKRVQLDRGGLSDAEFGRFSTFSNNLASELTDENGISFTSGGITDAGGYTSTTLTGATGTPTYSSNLQGQFYGPDAAEVAGTFRAHGLAVGGRAQDADLSGDLSADRGDIVGAFGAVRDDLMPMESDN